ncbi:MAG: prolipoprotein diacylglyceryl transferase [Clostridia bacterium]|nr:prolipoprotein diacylglyceryl transferase [Clostridia bacterium]
MDSTTISFPGLGIGEFELNKIIFSIGKFSVRWYGLIITLGIVVAFLYAAHRAKEKNFKLEQLIDLALYCVIFAIVGARLYYVLTSLDKYESFWDIFKIWEGGLGFYGGLFGGAAALIVACKIKKYNWRFLCDCAAPGTMLAQAMGRWGNFFNGEAYGAVVPEGHPLYFLRMSISPHYDITDIPQGIPAEVHPTFLYESLWNLIGFALINLFYKKKKFDGEIVMWYIAWYGLGRAFIEALRTDSLYIPGTNLKISIVVGVLCVLAGVGITVGVRVYLYNKEKKNAAPSDYQPIFATSAGDAATEQAGAELTQEAQKGENAEPDAADETTDESDAVGNTGTGEEKDLTVPTEEEKPVDENEKKEPQEADDGTNT